MSRMQRLMWIAPLAVVGMIAFVFLGGWMVMTLWNWLTPGLFGFKEITMPQALALLVLCRMLFGGLGLHSGGPMLARRRMFERWERLSDEERERIRARMRSGGPCGPEQA